jgi:tetratricopeptide (TPR) repeat protein
MVPQSDSSSEGNEQDELQSGEDRIKVNGVEPGAAVAAGRGASARVINIFLKGGDIRWIPVVVVLLGVVGVLTFLFLQLRPVRPERMTKLFNVAIAEFIVQDTAGDRIESEDGVNLANFLVEQINIHFEELEFEKIVSYEIWGPTETGMVEGNTSQERAERAEDLAHEINAHIVVYGVLTFDGNRSRFSPEFFVNHSSFLEADEITGQHELGKELRITLPLEEQIQPIENPALSGRINALNSITIGLAYYSIDDFENALTYFDLAEIEEKWLDTAGKEIIYLLLGNTFSRLASKEQAPEYLSEAEQNYLKALHLDNNYGRAIVGQAGVEFLNAQGTPPDWVPNLEGYEQASQLLNQALNLEDQPDTANIETKAHFLLGQIALAKYEARIEVDDWLTKSHEEFLNVISDYNSGDTRVENLASHAYARLGVIAFLQENPEEAILNINEAIRLASPFYEGEYYALLGDIYCEEKLNQEAIDAYEEALAIAEANGDAKRALEYETKINADCGV